MAVLEIVEATKQAIVSVIKGVPNTGNVYDRVKYNSNWQRFRDDFLFADPATGYTQVRGWWITIPVLSEYPQGRSFDAHWHNYTYPIRAVMSYSDKGDTEPVFNDMIWKVFDQLHDQGTLGLGPNNPTIDQFGNPAFVIDGSIDVAVPVVDMRFFGSILCHYAEMRMQVGLADQVNFIP